MPADDALGSPARQARRKSRSHVPFTRRAAAFVLLLCLPAVTASTAPLNDSSTVKPSYTLTAWTGQGDVSLGDVFAIAEDRDGYLWLGTSNGLFRFDGAVFSRRATGTSTRATEGPVSALLGASDGSLWVGGAGRFAADEDRRDHGLQSRHRSPARIVSPRFSKTGREPSGQGGAAASPPSVTTAGSLWQSRRNWATGPSTAFMKTAMAGCGWAHPKGVYANALHGFELSLAEPTFVQDFAQDRHGQMWVTDTRETIKRLTTGEGPIHLPGARVPEGGWRMAADRDGNLWVAALGGGLLRLVDDASGAPALERFPYQHKISGSPRSIYSDRNGNLWVGMRAGGLLRVSENSIRNQLPLEGSDQRWRPRRERGAGRFGLGRHRTQPQSIHRRAPGGRTRYRKLARWRWMHRVSSGSPRCMDSDVSRTADSPASNSRRMCVGRRS